ncbi:hypothetical protein EV401DRAFT_596346 [Pisolithus croceorrhizus]|nr:hypothetical protein EV401DRAFT_596346 [Pisolithus croceorrhizus]
MKICLVIGVLKLTSLSSGWPRLDLCGDARILILQFPALVPSTLLAWDPHSSPCLPSFDPARQDTVGIRSRLMTFGIRRCSDLLRWNPRSNVECFTSVLFGPVVSQHSYHRAFHVELIKLRRRHSQFSFLSLLLGSIIGIVGEYFRKRT